ncbi:CRISPR-associated RAMP protein [candidate division KSB1 bacterium]|nr:MAG: CRISPR-associated RAMP protein [candidate division KSB1 bacterium]MCE7945533.1 CRISPR-associated RAMP protein [Chlorobi bacterium CHB1]MDL1878005.1 CRISPR-associated RAMP protein [Cytophagia bacterium CHB2]
MISFNSTLKTCGQNRRQAMFKRLVNECTIELRLKPEGALLIKSGLEQVSDVKMAWVKVYRGDRSDPEVYLPGSSLKGTIRSHAERIARTIKSNAACDPFSPQGELAACGNVLDDLKRSKRGNDPTTPEVYKNSCLACRLFGNTWLLGRFATEDAYIEGDPPQIQVRDNVGIDRFTGGSFHSAKFDLEVITGGIFKTTLHLQNFELWQLGLIGFVLQDMKDGLVRMGSGKSRGLGKVVADIGKITLHYLGTAPKIAENGHFNIMGVGALFEQYEQYGMVKDDRVQVESGRGEMLPSPFSALRQSMTFTFDNFPWQPVADRWVQYAQAYKDGLEKQRGGSHGR